MPGPVRQTVLGFIRAIDARRGFDWDLSLALTRAGDGREFDSDVLFADLGARPVPFALNRRGSGGTVFARLEAGGTEDPTLVRSDATFLRREIGVGRTFGGTGSIDLRLFGEILDADRDFEDSREIGLRLSGSRPAGSFRRPTRFLWIALMSGATTPRSG